MSGRQYQPFINNSLAIRQEIQRFESVHPSIYAIYDLIELIPDAIVSQQIREHVVCIEDSFVNSQEWTLSRSVPDLRLGIVGSLASGKSALVHRYLTGSYMQEESPEGGRFKKEVQLDGQSYLLLIRDEGGPPELQFTAWVDAVIFVFSLESEASFNAIYSYYTKMAQNRNVAEVPLLLVGTQDAISETSPRVIDDARARKLAADLKCCGYYETCATYGLAVQQVFLDACLRIVQSRVSAGPVGTPTTSRPTTPIHGAVGGVGRYHAAGHTLGPSCVAPSHAQCSPSPGHKDNLSRQVHTLSASSHQLYRHPELSKGVEPLAIAGIAGSYSTLGPGLPVTPVEMRDTDRLCNSEGMTPPPRDKDLPTPTSTPTTSRKSRRRSNLFTSSKKSDEKSKNGELGSGRAIPLKQGFLHKRSSKSLKEWKKKYVTLCDDGIFTYYPNLQDYMDDVHGKQIPLQYVTVKVPGQKPRGSRATLPPSNGLSEGLSSLSISSYLGKDRRLHEGSKEPVGEDGYLCFTNGSHLRPDANNVKKRHRRIKSSGLKTGDAEESDGYEFLIVSLDSKFWHFDAGSLDDRDDWVAAIEQQILLSLQGSGVHVDAVGVQAVRHVEGNSYCADCNAPNPDWASLNLGILVCIECSGIHRNLGSHITKIRSLHLDDWPPGHLSVMLSLGNSLANSVWEHGARGPRPGPTSSREEKERWIRRKYEAKEFLAPAPQPPLGPELVEAVCRSDLQSIYLILAHATAEDVNCTVSPRDTRTPLHLACTLGSLPIAQLLIWYGANVQSLDQDGRSCLVYARAAAGAESSSLVDLLVAAGCPDAGSLKIPHTVI